METKQPARSFHLQHFELIRSRERQFAPLNSTNIQFALTDVSVWCLDNFRDQSQRDCIIQPRVGATAPTLGLNAKEIHNPNGVAPLYPIRMNATPSELCLVAEETQGSSQARNPGLNDGIPLGFGPDAHLKLRVLCQS